MWQYFSSGNKPRLIGVCFKFKNMLHGEDNGEIKI